ncbi:MAG: hypothetical protein PHF21_01320 [Bacilli bacterium]|nr:hypothetical protein [Bacilli bacterium]
MQPLNVGVTNIIAIDNLKKENFIKKYNEGLLAMKNEIATNTQKNEQQIINTPTNPSVTNADILSQNLSAPISDANLEANPVENKKQEQIGNQALSTDSDLTEIMYDVASIQDSLDKLVAKIIASFPNKEVVETKTANEDIMNPMIKDDPLIVENNPIQQEVVNQSTLPNQNTTIPQLQKEPQQEVSPFTPSTENIFDQPQGPNLAA